MADIDRINILKKKLDEILMEKNRGGGDSNITISEAHEISLKHAELSANVDLLTTHVALMLRKIVDGANLLLEEESDEY